MPIRRSNPNSSPTHKLAKERNVEHSTQERAHTISSSSSSSSYLVAGGGADVHLLPCTRFSSALPYEARMWRGLTPLPLFHSVIHYQRSASIQNATHLKKGRMVLRNFDDFRAWFGTPIRSGNDARARLCLRTRTYTRYIPVCVCVVMGKDWAKHKGRRKWKERRKATKEGPEEGHATAN